MIAGLGVDIRALIPLTVQLGGHVRVGLEDALLGSTTSNVRLVDEAAQLIEKSGGAIATPTQLRAELFSKLS